MLMEPISDAMCRGVSCLCACVCVYVCVYVCAHVCACVCTCARERVSHSCIVRTQCVKQTILQTTYSTIHHPVWSWKVDV